MLAVPRSGTKFKVGRSPTTAPVLIPPAPGAKPRGRRGTQLASQHPAPKKTNAWHPMFVVWAHARRVAKRPLRQRRGPNHASVAPMVFRLGSSIFRRSRAPSLRPWDVGPGPVHAPFHGLVPCRKPERRLE